MRTFFPLLFAPVLVMALAQPLPAAETERAWFSVDPAHWTADGTHWISSVDGGTWSRPDSDASELIAADGDQAAHIALDTGDGILGYTPATPSVGPVVHTDATLFFCASPQLPEIPANVPQGALSVWDTGSGLTYVGLVNGTWIPLSNNAAPPVTNDYVDARITLDYSGAAPTVSYAVKVGNDYVTLHDAEDHTGFATAVPNATAVTSVGFSGSGRIGTFSGAEVVNLEDYDIYINLDGETAGFFLGTDVDYGEGSWEHVTAASPREALRLAAEQKFGPGAIVVSDGPYGSSLIAINGMSGFGDSLSSLQDAPGYGDVYFYPIHWVQENGVWQVLSSSPIMDYAGTSRTFALTFQATSFDDTETLHTFEYEEDAAVYEALKETYAWPGWGEPAAPNIAVTNVAVDATASVGVGETLTLVAAVLPLDALNRNVVWMTGDAAVATVTDAGVVTGVAPGTATLTATTVDGYLTAQCVVTVAAAADVLADGGVTIAAGAGAITFTDIRPGEATLRFEGTIAGEPGASGTFALCYSRTLGGEEFSTNVTVVIQADGTALVQGIPADLPSFFAVGFAEKKE